MNFIKIALVIMNIGLCTTTFAQREGSRGGGTIIKNKDGTYVLREFEELKAQEQGYFETLRAADTGAWMTGAQYLERSPEFSGRLKYITQMSPELGNYLSQRIQNLKIKVERLPHLSGELPKDIYGYVAIGWGNGEPLVDLNDSSNHVKVALSLLKGNELLMDENAFPGNNKDLYFFIPLLAQIQNPTLKNKNFYLMELIRSIYKLSQMNRQDFSQVIDSNQLDFDKVIQ